MGCSQSQPESSKNSTINDNVINSVKKLKISKSIRASAHNDLDVILVDSTINLISYKGSIDWNDIKSNNNATHPNDQLVLGDGGFGTVVKLLWQFEPNHKVEVAVKVIQKIQVDSEAEYRAILQKIESRAETIRNTENKMIFKDCIIKIYGLCQGPLPLQVTQYFKLKRGDEGIGMVMRLEKGGSLKTLIHLENTRESRQTRTLKPFTMANKINIIFQLARAIAELHSVGIVHGDIKPGNVLFSSSTPPVIVRLADFGFAKEHQIMLGASSISTTKTKSGTPFYNAPEMFINPKQLDSDSESIARVSRKTDIYSYAIVIWEIMTEEQPFKMFYKEETLGTHLHRGKREDMSKCPKDTPREVIDMIQSCWNGDRKKRKSAIDCLVILEQLDLIHSQAEAVDVLINCVSASALPYPIMKLIFHYFVRHGHSVFVIEEDEPAVATSGSSSSSESVQEALSVDIVTSHAKFDSSSNSSIISKHDSTNKSIHKPEFRRSSNGIISNSELLICDSRYLDTANKFRRSHRVKITAATASIAASSASASGYTDTLLVTFSADNSSRNDGTHANTVAHSSSSSNSSSSSSPTATDSKLSSPTTATTTAALEINISFLTQLYDNYLTEYKVDNSLEFENYYFSQDAATVCLENMHACFKTSVIDKLNNSNNNNNNNNNNRNNSSYVICLK